MTIFTRFVELVEKSDSIKIGTKLKKRKVILEKSARHKYNKYFKNKEEYFVFKIRDFDILKRDKRESCIDIIHIKDKDSHSINIVPDFKLNHIHEKEFHLNLTFDSEEILNNCVECNKYFKNINHYPFSKEIIYKKFIDGDDVVRLIYDKLEQTDFFKIYKCS